jgi:hypothetical protein
VLCTRFVLNLKLFENFRFVCHYGDSRLCIMLFKFIIVCYVWGISGIILWNIVSPT